jgi:hypothetical protein
MTVGMIRLVGREVPRVHLAAETRRESSIGSRSLFRRSLAIASWSYDATVGRSSSMQRCTRSAKISAASATWPMISRAVHSSNFVARSRSSGTVRTIRAIVEASSARKKALSSS